MEKLKTASERNERDGVLGAEGRVQQRIDRNIAFLPAAPIGKSREELLAARRAERANAAYSAYAAYQPQRPPKFTAQPEPFWKLPRPGAPKGQYVTTASTRRRGPSSRARRSTERPVRAGEHDGGSHRGGQRARRRRRRRPHTAAPAPSASSPDLLLSGSKSGDARAAAVVGEA